MNASSELLQRNLGGSSYHKDVYQIICFKVYMMGFGA